MKKVLNALVEQLSTLSLAFENVTAERDRLAAENEELRERLQRMESANNRTPRTPLPATSSHDPDCHETERLRSVVIEGVPECRSPYMRDRLRYDYDSALNVLDYLGVECHPTSVYRLGKPGIRSNRRLLKVVLPSRTHQRIAVSRASRLHSFPGGWVRLRESLPRGELERRREVNLNRSRTQVSSQQPRNHEPIVGPILSNTSSNPYLN